MKKEVLVGIGPAIGPCCYEVGTEVADKFRTSFPYADACLLKEQDGHTYLDLWEANRQQMLRAGVPEENIQVAGECTCCRHKWWKRKETHERRPTDVSAFLSGGLSC